jgi:polar amino acid transport system substrate-binding protein
MLFKRLVQAATAAFVLAAAQPAPAQQVLKVGSTPTGIPFTFLDTKSNSIQGLMVDLITEIGKDAGFQVQIEPMQFSALIASLTSNKIDIISAAMFATAARKEVSIFRIRSTPMARVSWCRRPTRRTMPRWKICKARSLAPRSAPPLSTR